MIRENRMMAAEIAQLKMVIEQGRNKPPMTLRNSSQPPSRDFKTEKKKRKRNKKKGAKPGHEKQERQ
jgi:hypothetical protein